MTTATQPRGFQGDLLWQKGQASLGRNDVGGARNVLTAYQVLGRGNDTHAHLLASQIAWHEDRVRDSTAEALEAARIAPDDAETLNAVVGVLLDIGENLAARECLARLSLEGCDDPLLLTGLATMHKRLEQHAESMLLLDQAKALGNVNPALRYARGRALIVRGRIDEAEEELAKTLAEAPDRGTVAVPLVRLRRQTPERNWLPAIESGIRTAGIAPDEQAAFEFARYATLEDLGRHDEAWQALARGNALMRAHLPDETPHLPAWLDRFLPAVAAAQPRGAQEPMEGPVPIFIIGIPRSGTTLLERMLGNHTQVTAAGELMDFRQQFLWSADTSNIFGEKFLTRVAGLDYAGLGRRYLLQTQWRAHGTPFYIDKNPPNWMFAGPIHAALPRAPILNLVRDPVDTCFSNWRVFFGNTCGYSYDLAAMAAYFRTYQRTLEHWHRVMPGAILDVNYTDLVSDPDRILRQAFDFCGLGWEPGCADLARNQSPSATPSAAQVRGPLRTDRGNLWRPYQAQLAPLLQALGTGATDPA
ncbi:MAG TPA: sulfotransferase [Rhodanobacteraceae bacterium]|nr:sulfotransferase [Rhodanobacteraceae bacterium]